MPAACLPACRRELLEGAASGPGDAAFQVPPAGRLGATLHPGEALGPYGDHVEKVILSHLDR